MEILCSVFADPICHGKMVTFMSFPAMNGTCNIFGLVLLDKKQKT